MSLITGKACPLCGALVPHQVCFYGSTWSPVVGSGTGEVVDEGMRLRAALTSAEEQARLGWERAGEKDRAYSELLGKLSTLHKVVSEREHWHTTLRGEYECTRDAIEELRKRPALAAPVVCTWQISDEVDHDYYSTTCGRAFVLLTGTPSENEYNHCPGCGGKISEAPRQLNMEGI